VAQVVAYTLKIPLEKVTIKPSNSVVGANSQVTGGSLGSEAVAFVFKTILKCAHTFTNNLFLLPRVL
jgi:CO/xanthine dehydrogenase Mo-binding subunit